MRHAHPAMRILCRSTRSPSLLTCSLCPRTVALVNTLGCKRIKRPQNAKTWDGEFVCARDPCSSVSYLVDSCGGSVPLSGIWPTKSVRRRARDMLVEHLLLVQEDKNPSTVWSLQHSICWPQLGTVDTLCMLITPFKCVHASGCFSLTIERIQQREWGTCGD